VRRWLWRKAAPLPADLVARLHRNRQDQQRILVAIDDHRRVASSQVPEHALGLGHCNVSHLIDEIYRVACAPSSHAWPDQRALPGVS
jgi:hypothetical protein